MIYDLFFYFFSALTLFSAMMVVLSQHPVRSALYLIFAFVNSAGLWMLMRSEFLSLILIFVYVGAVMTLFLFVVMMINTERYENVGIEASQYTAISIIVGAILLYFLYHLLVYSQPASEALVTPVVSPAKALGKILYTDHALAFILVGIILIAGMIAAVSLVFQGSRKGTKTQKPSQQMAVTKAQRLRIIKDQQGNKS